MVQIMYLAHSLQWAPLKMLYFTITGSYRTPPPKDYWFVLINDCPIWGVWKAMQVIWSQARDSHPIKLQSLRSILRLEKVIIMDRMMSLSVCVSECTCQCGEDEYRFQSYSFKNLCAVERPGLICSQCFLALNTYASTTEPVWRSIQFPANLVTFHCGLSFFSALCLNPQMDWFTGSWMSQLNGGISRYCSFS